jgi:hypothetical protein
MTAVLTVTCDRCDQVIDRDRHRLLAESGSLRQRRPEGIDLCPACFARLEAWLDDRPGGRAAAELVAWLDGPEPAARSAH